MTNVCRQKDKYYLLLYFWANKINYCGPSEYSARLLRPFRQMQPVIDGAIEQDQPQQRLHGRLEKMRRVNLIYD